MFKQTIDNINEANQNHVIPSLCDCSDATTKTNNDFMFSLTNGVMRVYSGSKDNWFQIGLLKNKIRNNVDNGKYDSYNGFRLIIKNISKIVGTHFDPKQKTNSTSLL